MWGEAVPWFPQPITAEGKAGFRWQEGGSQAAAAAADTEEEKAEHGKEGEVGRER